MWRRSLDCLDFGISLYFGQNRSKCKLSFIIGHWHLRRCLYAVGTINLLQRYRNAFLIIAKST